MHVCIYAYIHVIWSGPRCRGRSCCSQCMHACIFDWACKQKFLHTHTYIHTYIHTAIERTPTMPAITMRQECLLRLSRCDNSLVEEAMRRFVPHSVCMCDVCMCLCMYVCVYVYVCDNSLVEEAMRRFVPHLVCMYVCVCICMYVGMP